MEKEFSQKEQNEEQSKIKGGLGGKLLFGIFGLPFLCMMGLILLILPLPLMIIGGDDIYNSNSSDQGYGYYDSELTIAVTGDFGWPVPGYMKISSGFGSRIHPLDNIKKMHSGIDIPAPKGTDIVATNGGIVIFSGDQGGGYGNLVIISHGNNIKTYYAHNHVNLVKQGDEVVKGQRIAQIGSTGRSTGPHLHYEVRINNAPTDPLKQYSVTRNIPNILPEDMKFKKVEPDKVRQYLEGKKSYLAKDMYVQQFISAAEEFDIDVLILVAITGQEQSFVPNTHAKAHQIAKNPFNVFGSWQKYGKSFEDSARIAAKTVVKLSQDRPANEHPIRWLSSKANPRGFYASDGQWWVGVTKFYETLRREVGYVTNDF